MQKRASVAHPDVTDVPNVSKHYVTTLQHYKQV